MSRDSEIAFDDLSEALEAAVVAPQFGATPSEYCTLLERGDGDFWGSIHEPFMARELNRSQVREVIAEGLTRVDGSYKRLLRVFRIAESDYLKFMDFLRYHRLKPDGRWRRALARSDSLAGDHPPSVRGTLGKICTPTTKEGYFQAPWKPYHKE